jgi:predicted dehydrogenase
MPKADNTAANDSRIAWGILGAGRIAMTFARGLAASRTGRLVAVGSRSREKAARFASEHGAARSHGSYAALVEDPEVRAVYIATPHPQHAEWAAHAARAGRHVLCEKPLTVNYAQAAEVVEIARSARVLLMEAFMYRCHPQTARLVELLRQEIIGEVRVIEARFSYASAFNPESRTFSNELAGGGILDVGCYPVSLARLIAGAARGADFADPLEVKGAGHLGPTGVDEYASAVMRFPGDIIAEVAAGVTVSRKSCAVVHGSAGSIVLSNPWVSNRAAPDCPEILIQLAAEKEPRLIPVSAPVTSFSLEADVFGDALAAGRLEAPPPAMTSADSLGNMRTLDMWRAAVGLAYGFERRD